MLTYDTTLQVIPRTTQKDLLLNLSLLGRHFLFFFLLAGVSATGKREKTREKGKRRRSGGRRRSSKRSSGGREGEENSRSGWFAAVSESRSKSRTSCRRGSLQAGENGE